MKTTQVEEPLGGTSSSSLRVFVSYDRGNVKSVKTLAEELGALGHQVWFDQDLTGGHRWWDSILAQIRECGLFVFALTPESLESHACRKELDYARRLNREILPILMSEEVSVSLLPRCLAEIQYVDYRRQDRQTAFALIRAINRLPAPAPLPDPLPEAPAAPGSHLGELKERIDSTGELNIEEQIAIVFKLKEEIRVGRSPDEVRGLLRRLRERDDLLAKVAKEI
jgi:TIR domain-containing protein